MDYSEDEFLQLSALQHFVFCKRQCALIHIEQAWSENWLTAEGRIMHEHVHQEETERRAHIRIVRGMLLHSFELGLVGKADVVEFHETDKGDDWIPFPIEYKRGRPKADDSDRIQLCAQALCLEEMMDKDIRNGALYYGRTKRRLDVPFDYDLRRKTKDTAMQLRSFIDAGRTPAPIHGPKCRLCSFVDECLPKACEKGLSVERYLSREITKP